MAWYLKIRNSDWPDGKYLIAPITGRYGNRRDAESAASSLLKDPKFTVEFLRERPKIRKEVR